EYVGEDWDVLKKYPIKANHTLVINGTGKFCTPGFIDSHVHLLAAGLSTSDHFVDLHSVTTQQEFTQKISDAVKTKKEGEWVQGGSWNNVNWGGQYPNKTWIDSVSPSNPVYLEHWSSHLVLVNSVALAQFKITKETPEIEGGVIGRDQNGEPNGLLFDEAMGLVTPAMPSEEQSKSAIKSAMKELNKFGITSAVNMGSFNEYKLHRQLANDNNLTLRVMSATPLHQWQNMSNEITYLKENGLYDNNYLFVGMLKGFADGALGSHTAALIDAYADQPNNKGVLVTPPQDLSQWVNEADKHKLQVCIHAIGDEANRLTLEIYDNVTAANGRRDRRYRIEHAQQVQLQHIESFKKNKIIASLQPIHMVDDFEYASELLGDRTVDLYRLYSLNNATTTVYGSDWSVASPDVRLGIVAAMSRQSKKYPQGYNLEESVPRIEDVLKSYTVHAAHAMFKEEQVGKIKEAQFADITIWDSSLIDLANNKQWEALKSVKVHKTIVGGKVVYSNE
ncbi:ytcJ, partial [Acrasis kona]